MSSQGNKIAEKWRRPSVSDDVKICRICDRTLDDPRTLPCMHSFCSECLLLLLQSYENHDQLERTFLCPVCKVHTPCHFLGNVTEKWLQMFPRKSDIDKMKEAILLVEERCQPCSQNWKVVPATEFCVECQEYMCMDCDTGHKSTPNNKSHKTVPYEVNKMKNTPASSISKFNCKLHSSLRYTSFCEIHRQFLCNTCKDDSAHRHCRVTSKVIESTHRITKAETKLTTVNNLNRDEKNKGKQLMKLIEQIDNIQTRLQRFREEQENQYCNYVMQAIMTEQKTEAIDALKGKLEFAKTHQTHDAIYATMNKVEDIITGYTDLWQEDDTKLVKKEVHQGITDIEKIVGKYIFYVPDKKASQNKKENYVKTKPQETIPDVYHVCKKHLEDSLDEDSFNDLGSLMTSVGALCYSNMFATAFRVGSKYLMTAAHTVRDIVDPERTGESEWSKLEARSTDVTFGTQRSNDDQKFKISQHIPYLDDSLNIAILEMIADNNIPPPLVLSTKDIDSLPDVRHVAVVGFGHSGSQAKHLDIRCPLVATDSDRAKFANDWLKLEERKQRCNLLVEKDKTVVNWNYDAMKMPNRFAVDCCMEYRAMGAPVLAYTGPSRVEVVGIFTHNAPDCFSELPEKIRSKHKEYRFEVATKMSSLYEELTVETRVLADDIFYKDKNNF